MDPLGSAAGSPREPGVAFSTDGRTFHFEEAVPGTARLGSFVTLVGDTTTERLGQILQIVPDAGGRTISGSGRLLTPAATPDDAEGGGWDPFGGAALAPAPAPLVGRHLAESSDGAILGIGSVGVAPSVPASLPAKAFARHTFLCGQSGSGKTYTLGLILERLLLETDLRIAVLDPNSDYVNLGDLTPGGAGDNGPSAADRDRWQSEIGPSVHILTGERLKYRFANMQLAQQAMTLSMDPLRDAEEMDLLRSLAETMGRPDYTVADLRDRAAGQTDEVARRLRLRIDNMGIANLGLWAGQGEHPVIEQLPPDWRAAVFDLGGLATAVERSIVAAGLLSYAWERRRDRRPMLIVIDEAHHVGPQEPSGEQQKLALEHLIAIAGEGRKFGIYLLLATQRPQKIHESITSQCENLILMRMTSAADVAALTSTFSFAPPGLIEASTSFQLGEGLAAGRIAPAPLLFRSGARWTREGGGDVPATWAARRAAGSPTA